MVDLRRIAGVLGAALTAAAIFGSVPATAATPGASSLDRKSETVSWSGQVTRAEAPSGEVPECSSTPCDRFDLTVDLPRGVWKKNRSGGLEVSTRWFGTFGDNVRLYVYRGATRVAQSDGIIATAQSVRIPSPANGLYRVYVAFDPDSVGDQVAYEGLAQVEYAPKPRPTRPLLPDLVALEHRNVTFQTPLDFGFEPPPTPGDSCFGSEKNEEGAQTCLRFDQVFANTGEGPLEVRFRLPHDAGSDDRSVLQRIYRSDGPDTYEDRSAGEWEYHPIHDHYHFTSFGISRLWATHGGQRAGAAPVRSSRKVSFCIVDIEIAGWGEPGTGPRSYSFPACVTPTESSADSNFLVQGMSAGWADVYDWFLPDQYVEVTGVPDGVYVLETVADPDNAIREASESNNCGSVYVRLSRMGTASPAAELIGRGPSC